MWYKTLRVLRSTENVFSETAIRPFNVILILNGFWASYFSNNIIISTITNHHPSIFSFLQGHELINEELNGENSLLTYYTDFLLKFKKWNENSVSELWWSHLSVWCPIDDEHVFWPLVTAFPVLRFKVLFPL